MRIQRWPKELDTPFYTKGIQSRPIRNAVPHRSRKLRKKGGRIERRRDENILAGRRIGHINEAVRRAARNAYDVTYLGMEASSIDLVKVASLDDAKDFRFAVPVLRWSLSGRVDRFDDAERASAGGGRYPHEEIKPDSRNFYGQLRASGVDKG